MATAAEITALATAINVQAPAALVEALREIERLREENERWRGEYRILKIAALQGDAFVNPGLDPNQRYMQTWAEVANDLGDEAEMAWNYAERLKEELDALKERAGNRGSATPTEAPRGGEQLASGRAA